MTNPSRDNTQIALTLLRQYKSRLETMVPQNPESFAGYDAALKSVNEVIAVFEMDPDESTTKYLLVPGDRALYLQASCLEEMAILKKSLSEFNYANYETSAIYEKARAAEPDIFFPRIFCIEILPNPAPIANSLSGAPLRDPRPVDIGNAYMAKILGEMPTIGYFPMRCEKSAVFVTEADLAELRAIYKKNMADSEAWLDEMRIVKEFELKRKFDRLKESMSLETKDSWAAFDLYGLYGGEEQLMPPVVADPETDNADVVGEK